MNTSPAQQRFPRLTRVLPVTAQVLWYIVAIVVGRALHAGPFDCRHSFLPCVVSAAFSDVLVVAGTLGIMCLIGHGITTMWTGGSEANAGAASFLKDWFQIALDIINPVIYATAIALGIAMFAVHQLWFAFAFVFGGGFGLFMQMPTLIALIRENAE